MRTLGLWLRELWGLFVDDGSLAVALVLWCAAAGLGLRLLPVANALDAPLLFAGCLAILIVNVARAARRYRGR